MTPNWMLGGSKRHTDIRYRPQKGPVIQGSRIRCEIRVRALAASARRRRPAMQARGFSPCFDNNQELISCSAQTQDWSGTCGV